MSEESVTGEGAEAAGATTRDEVVAAAAAERRSAPTSAVEEADLADRYDQMLRLADLLDDTGAQMRAWSHLGREILEDPDVADSATLSPRTWTVAEEEIRNATTGKGGLMARSIDLDADALVLRATVLTYRWIDDLQAAAYQTLGSIAGRAIGYLAPEVSLGGAVVAAGLIETDALDRDGVAAYLGELAEANPELMEHVTTGGGLLDSLQMRALLASPALSGDSARSARSGGLRAAGIAPLDECWSSALRDVALSLPEEDEPDPQRSAPDDTDAASYGHTPEGLEELMALLVGEPGVDPVRIIRIGPRRLLTLLTGAPVRTAAAPGRLRLVSDGVAGGARDVVRQLEAACAALDGEGDGPVRVVLAGRGRGGAHAVDVATRPDLPGFVVDHVLTADAPGSLAPRLPDGVAVLSVEDRTDPVALLGSLINAGADHRISVVYDAAPAANEGLPPLVAAGRAIDRADHPELVAMVERWRAEGVLRPLADPA